MAVIDSVNYIAQMSCMCLLIVQIESCTVIGIHDCHSSHFPMHLCVDPRVGVQLPLFRLRLQFHSQSAVFTILSCARPHGYVVP